MRVLRIYPTANDQRARRRDLALRQLGVEVGLVAPYSYGSDWAPSPIEPGLPHWRSRLLNKRSIPLHLWDPSALRRAVRAFEPDLVDIHEECYFPAAAEAVWAAAGRPTAMFAAQNIPKRVPAPVAALRRWVLPRVHGFYPCSSEAADVLRIWGYAGQCPVIPYGVEDEFFDVTPVGERVGFVGRLVQAKGVDDLLPFGARLLCVGEGPLADDVRAVGGEVVTAQSQQELARHLSRMAVLVAPSRTAAGWKEQFGRAVVEGMAAAVPVVAYDSGSLPEVLGDAGVIVREGDRQALLRAVEAVLAEPDGVGERGRARASERFRWSAVARRMVRLYEAILAG